jgi:tRNA U55 pseudouridine synthase TruB
MAYALGTVGYMRYIKRTASGAFSIDRSYTLKELETIDLESNLYSIEEILSSFARFDAPKGAERLLDNGVRMKLGVPNGVFTIYINDELTWIAEKNVEDDRIDFKARLK